jgi:hypothetical protein
VSDKPVGRPPVRRAVPSPSFPALVGRMGPSSFRARFSQNAAKISSLCLHFRLAKLDFHF